MRIAICDDNSIVLVRIRKEIEKVLEKHAPDQAQLVHILEYDNGFDLLDAHAKDNFDVVCLDVEMPGLNGLEVAQSLRRDGSDARYCLRQIEA